MANTKGNLPQAITVTSLKGGVGKTTISALLARYAIDVSPNPVLVVDLDPQAGLSSLLLGGRIKGPTIADVLDSESRGIASRGIWFEAVRPSRYHEQILVVPSRSALGRFAHLNDRTPRDLLARALRTARVPDKYLVIIDTGTDPGLVQLGLEAATAIVIPIMLSQQTARPTINTLVLASQVRSRRGALAPIGTGKALWENRELDRWRQQLLRDEALTSMGFAVMPSLPHSKAIIRGRWRYGTFPTRFESFFKALYSLAIGEKKPPANQPSSNRADRSGGPDRHSPSKCLNTPIPTDRHLVATPSGSHGN